MNTPALLASATFLLIGSAFIGCAPAGAPDASGEDVADEQDELQQFCGGIAGFGCPDGKVCVDNPHDDCDPANGGADCGGVCRPGKSPKKKCKDPNRIYVGNSPEECAAIRFYCESGEPFFDACGCGCELAPTGGEPCGANVCGAGESCCNASCGMCVPEGNFCIQIACEPQCSESDCGPALGMPNYLCDDGSVAGPTGNCLSTAEGGCGWEVLSCP